MIQKKARLALKNSGEKVKFKWIDGMVRIPSIFELHILVDELTKDVSLMVVDFAEKDEVAEASLLWENQISDLKHLIDLYSKIVFYNIPLP
jgi:hypothetical protein